MTPNPRPSSAERSGRRRRLAVAVPVLAALFAWPAAPAAGQSPDVTQVTPQLSPGGETYTVTLVTGDVATLHVASGGRQAAWLAEPATETDEAGPPEIYQQDGQAYVVPAEAAPYVSAGVLDDRLFNLTGLVEQGYDDASMPELPLLLAEPAAAAAQNAPAVRQERELSSIDGVSVTVDKEDMRSVWESLRGPEAAVPGEQDAELAGADQVWLNGRVEAMLGDSVGQVGAPAAWDAGFDGSGVTVAVLDTGHDPDHPDLADRVNAARNFTDEPDPAGQTAVDRNGHGTHVAATVAGTGAASGGQRQGVAPGADLLVGKVLGAEGGLDAWVIEGMEWAAEQGAQVVNMSLGSQFPSDGTDPLSLAVDRLTQETDTLFVVAAGNNGPIGGSVTSPGAATSALTVGATTKQDESADFSSRGPRRGDLALKPEIVGPGVDIVAARADGTSLGNLVDEHHTSLSGTSMAAPHVAGAAAIVAQQHPGSGADELKSHLVATSERLPDAQVNFQGAGRLDVAAATAADLTVDQGALSFGEIAQNSRPATRTLTYRNDSDETMTLRLSSEIRSTGAGGPRQPILRTRPAALVVPPGGEASTEVSLSPHTTQPGQYVGRIVARDQRNPGAEIRTTLTATVDGPDRTVTVNGIGRDGEPAGGRVQLWSAETGERITSNVVDGTATLEVPDGLYTMVVTLETTGISPASSTFTAEPDLRIRRDVTRDYDAREADQVEFATPRETYAERFHVFWHREVGGHSISATTRDGWDGAELYLLPSDPVREGTFETSIVWREAQPLLTAAVAGAGGYRIDPVPQLASQGTAYHGQESLPLVYAGGGTPEEFADVDADGKVALVSRRGDVFNPFREQAQAAADAGAQLLLVHNNVPDAWTAGTGIAAVPTYRIDQQAGQQLRQELADDPDLTLDLDGVQDSTYSYELAHVEHGSVPAGRVFPVERSEMAIVESSFRQDAEGMSNSEMWVPFLGSSDFASGSPWVRNGPVERTEQISTDDVRWQRFGQPGVALGSYWTWSEVEQYRAGETYHHEWWGTLTRPGIPDLSGSEQLGMPVARFRDAIRIALASHMFDNGRMYAMPETALGDMVELTLRRDGVEVGTANWPSAQFTVPPEDSGYELELSTSNGPGNWADTSSATESLWRFRSGRTEDARTVLPLVQVDYHLDAGLHNEMPGGEEYELRLQPGYQPGASGPGDFTTSVEVSYDDGDTWVDAPLTPADGMLAAAVPAAGGDAEFASVRVVATDSEGNSLDQLIERAWRIAGD